MTKLHLNYIMTLGWRVNISLRENYKTIRLALPIESKLFLVVLMDSYSERVFVRSIAVYHYHMC